MLAVVLEKPNIFAAAISWIKWHGMTGIPTANHILEERSRPIVLALMI